MKMILSTAFLFLAFHAVQGSEWRVLSRETLAAPEGLNFEHVEVSGAGGNAALYAVTFSQRKQTFAVMVNPAGVFDAATAATKRGALAAVNGGYFQPDHTPLGLVVRQGQQIHPLERSRLLSGLLVVSGDRISITRTGDFKASPQIREALQAGPFLIDGGRPVPGLESARSAARTVFFSTTQDISAFSPQTA